MLTRLKKMFQGSRGFTLIEAIAVLVIMGIVSMPLVYLSVTNLRSMTKAFQTSELANYAQGLIEEIIEIGSNSVAGWNSISDGYTGAISLPSEVTEFVSVSIDSTNGVIYKEVVLTMSHSELTEPLSVSTIVVRP